MPLIPAKNTALGAYEYIEHFKAGWYRKFNKYPTLETCLCSASQVVNETLWMEKIWHNNPGNITEPDQSKPYWSLKAPEFINGKWVLKSLRYCAFSTIEDGIDYYLDFLESSYKGAFDALQSGNPRKVAEELKKRKYYTAPLETYANNMAFAYEKLKKCYTQVMSYFGNRTFNLEPAVPWEWVARRKRNYVEELCEKVVPSKFTPTLDTIFSYVTQGRQRFKGYSSCGDLAHFVLYAMGCTDKRILNRTDAELGTSWEVGKNISKLVSGAKALECWRTLQDGLPQKGDIVLIGDFSKKQMEHVCVVKEWLEGGTPVTTYDYGQFDVVPCSKLISRVFNGTQLGNRDVVGYIDIESVPLSRYALEING
jgi:hypothetical protein